MIASPGARRRTVYQPDCLVDSFVGSCVRVEVDPGSAGSDGVGGRPDAASDSATDGSAEAEAEVVLAVATEGSAEAEVVVAVAMEDSAEAEVVVNHSSDTASEGGVAADDSLDTALVAVAGNGLNTASGGGVAVAAEDSLYTAFDSGVAAQGRTAGRVERHFVEKTQTRWVVRRPSNHLVLQKDLAVDLPGHSIDRSLDSSRPDPDRLRAAASWFPARPLKQREQ